MNLLKFERLGSAKKKICESKGCFFSIVLFISESRKKNVSWITQKIPSSRTVWDIDNNKNVS